MMFGHEFERENVKHFVEAGRELLGSKATLKGSTPLLVFLAIIPLFLGFIEFDKGYEILPGIASVMCVVVILIYLKRIEKKKRHMRAGLSRWDWITLRFHFKCLS